MNQTELILAEPLASSLRQVSNPLLARLREAQLEGDSLTKSRLSLYLRWLGAEGRSWVVPDFPAYRRYLKEQGKADNTIQAYVNTIKKVYEDLLYGNWFRDVLAAALPPGTAPETRYARIRELEDRVERALMPRYSYHPVKRQLDDPHLRLTPEQVAALLAQPNARTRKGLRDQALIGLMVCTGVRAAEVIALQIPDLRCHLGEAPALRVHSGKGNAERLIPYGHLIWGLHLTEQWLSAAGLTGGPVFRHLTKGDTFRRDDLGQPQALSSTAVYQILRQYPIDLDGQSTAVDPHDLRRTYARALYHAGVSLEAIARNLGHQDSKVTERYIGKVDAADRIPPDAYGNIASNFVSDQE